MSSASKGKTVKVDPNKTYIVKGELLDRIMTAVNEWENVDIKLVPAGSQPTITKGKLRTVISIPQFGVSGGGGGSTPAPTANLVLTTTRPRGYAAPPSGVSKPVFVTWGLVNGKIPTNIGSYTTATDGKKVWLRATTNGDPDPLLFRVTSVVIQSGTEMPEDSGGTSTTPPTQAYFMIGEIYVSDEVVTIYTREGGNLQLTLSPTGSTCFGASDAFPTGGSRTTYQLNWQSAP